MDVGKFSSKIHNAHARDHVTHRWRVKISTYLESKTPCLGCVFNDPAEWVPPGTG